MRLERVDLNLFVVFKTLYHERSVTGVASILNLTQPAISNSLNRLRRLFDDPLFVRTSDGMLPTPVADNLINDISLGLELFDKSINVNAHFDHSTSTKTFHLGMNDLGEYLILPALLKKLNDIAPNIKIESYYTDRKSASGSLKSGTLELLIDTMIEDVDVVDQQHIADLNYVVAMCPHHPSVSKKVDLAEYLRHEHLLVSSRRTGLGQMDFALNQLGHNRTIKTRVQSYQLAAKLIENSSLLWTVPEIYAQKSGLHYKPVPFNVPPLSWSFYWFKSSRHDPAQVWMRKLIAEIVKDKILI